MIYDYLILGGGITGIASARVLQKKGNNNFLVLESEKELGGLLRTKEISGHHFDIGGGHVLHSKYPEVLDWIFSHIPKDDFNEMKTNIMIDLDGYDISFPLELNLWQLPKDVQLEYIHSYLTAASETIEYKSFEDWVRNYLGDKIADNYMIPYNKKLWCTDISKLNTDWLSKIPKTNIKLILKTIIERDSNFNEDITSHATIMYPKKGGFQTLFDSIACHVTDNVKLNCPVSSVEYDHDTETWLINDLYRAKKIINTVPWPILNIKGFPSFNFEEECKNLETLKNVISLWEREPYTHDVHWKYIPNPAIDQHREFYIKNLAPHSKEGGVMTDINYERWLDHNKEWKAGVPLYEHVNMWAYPLPTKVYKESIQRIVNFFKDYKMFGLGRWGQWSYFNTDHCIKQVLEFFSDEEGFDFFNKEWFKN